MTVIQLLTPANAASSKPGQANSTDPQQTETFGASMLMAMLVPPLSQVALPHGGQVTSGPITDLPVQQESAENQNLTVREGTVGIPQEADGTSPRSIDAVSRTDSVPKTVVENGTPRQTVRQTTPHMNRSALNSTAPAQLPVPDGMIPASSPGRRATELSPVPVSNSVTSTNVSASLPGATPVAGSADAPVAPETTAATRIGDVPAAPETTTATRTGDVPAASETATPTRTGDVPTAPETATPTKQTNVLAPPPIKLGQEGEPPLQITVESSEISSGGTEANAGTSRLQHDAPEATNRTSAQPEAQTKPNVRAESAVRSTASSPIDSVGLAQDELQNSAQRTTVEGRPVQPLENEATPDHARGPVGKPSRELLPDELNESLQRQVPRRVSTSQPGRQLGRERLTARAVDGGAATANARDEVTLTDRMERQSGEGGRDETEHEGLGRVRTVAGRSSMPGATSPVVGAGSNGGVEKLAGQRVEPGRVEQSMLKAPVEEPSFVPKGADRVTLKFTDDAGVEGRLRVAVRGESVRATIVADDPAVAERFGSGISEIQRSLGSKGFREAHINVQTARSIDESGGLTIASGVRNASESVTGSSAARTNEDQANRERQHGGPRDQQHRNNGRSQQRSRERQER